MGCRSNVGLAGVYRQGGALALLHRTRQCSSEVLAYMLIANKGLCLGMEHSNGVC